MKITLCGSTKFKEHFEEWNQRLSKQGHVVYSVCSFGHRGDALTEAEKTTLDAVHKKKIDNSDAIVVLNPNGYIGDSTRSEINHAKTTGKEIFYLYPFNIPLAERSKRLCPYPGCANSTRHSPCALCYE